MMKTLILQAESLAQKIEKLGGLGVVWQDENSAGFTIYLELVDLCDDDFYLLCEDKNLDIDHYCDILFTTIKKHLPNFNY